MTIQEICKQIRELKKQKKYQDVINITERYIDEMEQTYDWKYYGVDPYYYLEIAKAYRRLENKEKEIAILKRYFSQKILPGIKTELIKIRLEKLIQN